jgi:hypothetical protein
MTTENETPQRPVYFYLVLRNGKAVIEQRTDTEMNELWNKGVRFLDVGKKSRADAEALLAEYQKQGY